jgi:hypothetical protein
VNEKFEVCLILLEILVQELRIQVCDSLFGDGLLESEFHPTDSAVMTNVVGELAQFLEKCAKAQPTRRRKSIAK